MLDGESLMEADDDFLKDDLGIKLGAHRKVKLLKIRKLKERQELEELEEQKRQQVELA